MREFFPLIIVGAVLGIVSLVFVIAFMTIRKQKEAIGFDRNMKDGEIIRRLSKYALRQWPSFLLVLLLMVFSIVYDIVSPLVIGELTESIQNETFTLPFLYTSVAVYASILVVSMVCTYIQAIVLQKTGQRILSALREDIFRHIDPAHLSSAESHQHIEHRLRQPVHCFLRHSAPP